MPRIHHQGANVPCARPSSQCAVPPLRRGCIMTHDEAWHALPFFINGTLRGPTRTAVETHLAQCAECRSELAGQAQVRDAILREDVRQENAQVSFDQLWDRIVED